MTEEEWSGDEAPGFRISLPPGRRPNPALSFHPPPSSGRLNPPPGAHEIMASVTLQDTAQALTWGRRNSFDDLGRTPVSYSDSVSEHGSSDGLIAPEDPDPSRLSDLCFRLGTRLVSAAGLAVDGSRNVLRLRLRPSMIAGILGAVAGLLPRAAQLWAKTRWPEWFLPQTVVLKKRKEGWDEEFENETHIYTRLRELQGVVIPVCYGLVVCGNPPVPALVLSDIGGHELYQPEAGAIPRDRLAKLLREAFEALARCGVGHGDLKLDNPHPVRDNGPRVMVVDLESVEDVDPAKSAFFVNSDIDHILRSYRDHQECLIDDGLLPRQQPE
jgi:hypothetical protein